ncbi:MAG TPA: PAS domain S-box protein, partial [Archangium sp.]
MELLRVVLDSVNEAVIVRAPDGRVIDCNAIAERVFGLTRGQMLQTEGLTPNYRTTAEDGSPVDLSNSPGAITIRTGVAQKSVPLKLHLPDGTLKWIQVSTTPLPDGRTEPPYGVVICLSDITEARTAKELALVAERRIEAMLEHSEGGVF